MNRKLFFFYFLILLLATACNNTSDDPKANSDSADQPTHTTTDTLVNNTDTSDVKSTPVPSVSEEHWLQGEHLFTLHWISWDRPGRVRIGPQKDGWHPVTGSQRDKDGNFVTIEGELQPISELELNFRGTILTKVDSINSGDTCIRNGEQKFLSTKNRKYWRLQNMENCEGGMVVDYIDIYFK